MSARKAQPDMFAPSSSPPASLLKSSPPATTTAAAAATASPPSPRGRLKSVGIDHALPFTPGRWTLASSGRSVNLPDGGKIRTEKRGDESRLAADMRLIQAGPALYLLAQEFRAFLVDGGAVPVEGGELVCWIEALNRWVAFGDDSFATDDGHLACRRCGHSADAHGSERGACQRCPKADRHRFAPPDSGTAAAAEQADEDSDANGDDGDDGDDDCTEVAALSPRE